jgi:uncharacterized protein YjbJ (UPF0337 family)
MNKDQFAGTAQSVGGKIEETVGAAIGDRTLQAEGVIDQVKGSAQQLFGDAKQAIHGTYDRVAPVARESFDRAVVATRQNAVLAVIAAGVVGFALAVAVRGDRQSGHNPWSR